MQQIDQRTGGHLPKLHYLWLAGFALNGKDPHNTEAWVQRFLRKQLTGAVENVIADIQRSVAQRGLKG